MLFLQLVFGLASAANPDATQTFNVLMTLWFTPVMLVTGFFVLKFSLIAAKERIDARRGAKRGAKPAAVV